MPQISVAPTRTNLIRLKKELRFAKEGYELLILLYCVAARNFTSIINQQEDSAISIFRLFKRKTPTIGATID